MLQSSMPGSTPQQGMTGAIRNNTYDGHITRPGTIGAIERSLLTPTLPVQKSEVLVYKFDSPLLLNLSALRRNQSSASPSALPLETLDQKV